MTGRNTPVDLSVLDKFVEDAHGEIAPAARDPEGVAGTEAVLAHYEVARTRCLDLTQVLHVAASFALHEKKDAAPAVIYAFRACKTKVPATHAKVFLVASTANRATTRPHRQAAWAAHPGTMPGGPRDYHPFVHDTFLIPADAVAKFWEDTAAYRHGWLMDRGGQGAVLERLKQEAIELGLADLPADS